ncbi:uncharacterized protein LOC109602518 isoform X3 [Aethina tumida]|uniref:uncharacterized protein LOC109602518 isoform X3 n=1 Tax=Aethina tumida TaxID=116153 RepID=UPI002148614E|nr:uncharacterized protein LOC109602518 isoform X3 [Aethina tumida]
MGVPSPSHGSGYATNIYGIFKIVELIVAAVVLLMVVTWVDTNMQYIPIAFIFWYIFSGLYLIFGLANKATKFMKLSWIVLIILGALGLAASIVVALDLEKTTRYIGSSKNTTMVYVGCILALVNSIIYIIDGILSVIGYKSANVMQEI